MKYLICIIIGIILFLVFREIINRLFPNLKTINNVVSGILAISLAPVIAKAMFILFFNLIMYEYHPNREFKVDSWKENVQDRHQMSEDIVENQILINKTKEQIVDKIGLPINKTNLNQDSLSNWRYNMGNRGWGFGLKFYYLQIKFKNGKSFEIDIQESID